MPSARKIAADNNLDIAQISGTGRGGRVTKEDVTNQLQAPASAKALALFFAQVGPARTKVAVHAPLPAVLHAFTHVRTPTRATR